MWGPSDSAYSRIAIDYGTADWQSGVRVSMYSAKTGQPLMFPGQGAESADLAPAAGQRERAGPTRLAGIGAE